MKHVENNNCVAFMARINQYYPGLSGLIYHIPNESRTAQNKHIGILAGIPDYCLPIPRNGKGALYIEFKKTGGRVSDIQKIRIEALRKFNAVEVAYSWQEGIGIIIDYLGDELINYMDKKL